MPNANVSRTVAYGGMLAALILVVTRFSAIPIMNGQGYLNLGDVTILFAAALLARLQQCPQRSARPWLMSGWLCPICTRDFIIKGLVALIAGLSLRKLNVTLPFKIFGMALAELAMAAGYLVFELFLLGRAIALFDLTFNLIQAGVCTLVAALLLPVAERIKKPAI
jgi:uncharacterized membrane protein